MSADYALRDRATRLFLVDVTVSGQITLSENARHALKLCDELAAQTVINSLRSMFDAFDFVPVETV